MSGYSDVRNDNMNSESSTKLNAYRVSHSGEILFEIVAESGKKARNLLAARLKRLTDINVTPSDCKLRHLGKVTAQ